MTKEDIIKMAQECNLIGMRPHLDGIYEKSLERFAALVAAYEIEECAKVCDDNAKEWKDGNNDWCQGQVTGSNDCASAIRARGNT